MIDPNKLTVKVQSVLRAAIDLAKEEQHVQWTPLHLAVVLFEDPEGTAGCQGVRALRSC
jgi:ATP-dependent Clp protease ATP-binding subunit ClpB